MAIRPFLKDLSKAKGGKLFRHLLDQFLSVKDQLAEQVVVVTESIEWTKTAKRRFLRQTLEVKELYARQGVRGLCLFSCAGG